jgi:hypothetical protein
MKVTVSPVTRTNYTIHDGVQVAGIATARCSVVSMRRRDWHVLPANMTTNCKRCLKIRESRPYIHNRTVAEET